LSVKKTEKEFYTEDTEDTEDTEKRGRAGGRKVMKKGTKKRT